MKEPVARAALPPKRLLGDAVRLLLLPVFAGLCACSTATIDMASIQAARIDTITLVVGSDTRGRTAVMGPILTEEILAPLPVDLESRLDSMALEHIQNALTRKGYKTTHLKTIPMHWDLMANIPDTRESHTNLFRQYDVPAGAGAASGNAILFVEYMLRPNTWGEEQISSLTLEAYKTMYAKSKLWIYDPRSGKRLFFSSTQRGYDQTLTHVSPAEALAQILGLEDVPAAAQ